MYSEILNLLNLGKQKIGQIKTDPCYDSLTLIMLNKLRCHAHSLLSANQMVWSRFLTHIYILNGNSADPDPPASEEKACYIWLSGIRV